MTFFDDTTEMQNRVAEAIFNACSGYMLRINCNAPARAAIEAMREPTAAMIEASDIGDEEFNVTNSVACTREFWKTMIDAALKRS